MLRIVTRCVQAVIVRPLSAVNALVRFAEEPQMFAIEFNDGCPIHVSICYPCFVFLIYCRVMFLMFMMYCRFMQARPVIAYLQQFAMCCKQK